MKNSRKFTLFNSIFHALIGMGYSITIGFGNPILASLGLDSGIIGILFATSMFLGILIQIGASIVVENKKIINVLQCFRLEALLMVILGILMIVFKSNIIIASLIFVTSLAVSTSGFPTLGALSIDIINSGVYFNFGLSRAMGSIGYSVLGFTGGYIINLFGTINLFYIYIIVNIVIVFMSFLHPTYKAININREDNSDSIFFLLFENKKFRNLIIGICFIFFSHNVINNFLKEIMDYVNATQVQYGLAIGLSTFLELPTLIIFGMIIKKVNNLTLLKISAVFMALKVIIETISTNFGGIVIAQFTQPFAYALFTPAVIFFMNDIVKERNQIKAQLMIGVASMGLGGGLGNIVGGILIKSFGIHFTMIFSSIIAAIGVSIFLFTLNMNVETRKVNNDNI